MLCSQQSPLIAKTVSRLSLGAVGSISLVASSQEQFTLWSVQSILLPTTRKGCFPEMVLPQLGRLSIPFICHLDPFRSLCVDSTLHRRTQFLKSTPGGNFVVITCLPRS